MKTSSGKTGQLAFELYAKRHGLSYDKVEPESHFVKDMGFIRSKTSGIFDYICCSDILLKYYAYEVKERPGDIYPCSILSKEQRKWADRKPAGTCYVAVWESDYGELEIFPWKKEGRWKRGEGIK